MAERQNASDGESRKIFSTNFSAAFTPGFHVRDEEGEELSIRVVQGGELLITSGSIVACDPFWLNMAPRAYTTKVPLGRFPVLISIAELAERNDRRIACAKLLFNLQDVVRWEMAAVSGQDVSTLKPGEYFCYGVDAGTGCFVDMDVVTELFERAGAHDLEKWRGLPDSMKDMPDERAGLIDAVYTYFETTVDTRLYETLTPGAYSHYGEVVLNDTTGGNLVHFSSGWGDGCYASYFGYAADGSLACLITDFAVLPGARP